MALDLTALNAKLGAYSRQKSREVLREIINDGMISDPDAELGAMDIMQTRFFRDEESFARVALEIQARERDANVVKQTDPVVSIEGDLRKLRDIESIFDINPEALLNTWLDQQGIFSERSKFKETLNFADIEFVPWLVNDILRKFMSKIYELTVFKGVYAAGYTYADSFPKAFDGYLQQIVDRITAGDITNVVPTGVLSQANTYTQLELMGQSLPYHLKNQPLFFMVSEQIHDWYNHGRSIAYPSENASVHPTFKTYRLKNRRRINLIPVAELDGSQRVIGTVNKNLSYNHDFLGNTPKVKFAVINTKQIEVAIQHSAGVSFDRFDNLVVNDQA